MGRPDWQVSADDLLAVWCNNKADQRHTTRDIRTFLCLVMWEIWKHRNSIVFDGARPSARHLVQRIVDEGVAWQQAGLLRGQWETQLEALRVWVCSE